MIFGSEAVIRYIGILFRLEHGGFRYFYFLYIKKFTSLDFRYDSYGRRK